MRKKTETLAKGGKSAACRGVGGISSMVGACDGNLGHHFAHVPPSHCRAPKLLFRANGANGLFRCRTMHLAGLTPPEPPCREPPAGLPCQLQLGVVVLRLWRSAFATFGSIFTPKYLPRCLFRYVPALY